MATKLGSDVGYRSGIYNGYKVIGTQTLGLRGLVLWLKFNEGSGNIAYDSSFYNNHGTIYGATWTDGKFGKALSFDGVDDYVKVADSASLDIADEITIEAWIYPTKIEYYHTFISKVKNWRNDGFVVRLTGDGRVQFITLDFDYDVITSPEIKTYTWYHIIAINKGGEFKRIYINGVLKGENTDKVADITLNDAPLYVGFEPIHPNERFNGTIDEVRIYNRALTEEEIKMLYYNRIGAVPSKTI